MTYLELLVDSLERARDRFLSLLDVTVEQANFFPDAEQMGQIKSLTWLTWHTAREIDFQISDLAGTEPVWFSKSWKDKFALDLSDDTEDWHHSFQEAQKVVVSDLSLLKGYLEDASDLAITYLKYLDESVLDDIIDDSWTPPVTRGARLISIIDDAAMHSGQAIYTHRLLGLLD